MTDNLQALCVSVREGVKDIERQKLECAETGSP